MEMVFVCIHKHDNSIYYDDETVDSSIQNAYC